MSQEPVHSGPDCSTSLRGREDRLGLILRNVLIFSGATPAPTTLLAAIISKTWMASSITKGNSQFSVKCDCPAARDTAFLQLPALLIPCLQTTAHPFFPGPPFHPLEALQFFTQMASNPYESLLFREGAT